SQDDQEAFAAAATANVALDLDPPNVQDREHACVDIAEHTSEAIETRLGNQPRLLRAQEVGDLVVERLWLLDERHVSRVADDHLPRALDAGAYVLRAYRPADEVLFARDHKRRTCDGGQAAAHVESREDLIVEELQRVGVDGLGLQRVEVARLRRSEMSEVQRPLPEDEL